MSPTTTFLMFAVLAALLVLVALTLHKVRRLHQTSFALREDAAVARREAETLFSQIQALLALDRTLGLAQPLPPMRGWAASPDMLLNLAQHILARRPATVAECSSGVSTVVAARCLQLNGAGHVYSLEHDAEYARKTQALLQRYGLEEWATVVVAPLEPGADGATWYHDAALPADMPPIDLLVVDGPPAGGDSTARYPALPRLLKRLARPFTLMLDDADRPGERGVVERWQRECPGLVLSRPPCEKGLAVLEGSP
jgi:predicted O-methyltransferase YrrM